jgi:hypothetical protein
MLSEDESLAIYNSVVESIKTSRPIEIKVNADDDGDDDGNTRYEENIFIPGKIVAVCRSVYEEE